MKTKIGCLFLILMGAINLYAQDVITVNARSYDISDNLNLEAVASLFGESSNLEDFEQKLNDPEIQISNLDLNQDGYVDYIRVIETSTDGIYLVTLQAVLGDDLFQDIATIDIERDESNTPRIQITGDAYLYGDGYIIEPVYVHIPTILDFLWIANHRIWHSPYYWRHYPVHFHPWEPYSVPRYRRHIQVHKNINITYRYPSNRMNPTVINLQNQTRRNDLGSKYPEKSFNRRYENVRNKQELDKNRSINNDNRVGTVRSTGRTVQKEWTPASGRSERTEKPNVTRSTSSPRQERTTTVKSSSESQQTKTTTVPKSRISDTPVKSNSGKSGSVNETKRTVPARSSTTEQDKSGKKNSTSKKTEQTRTKRNVQK